MESVRDQAGRRRNRPRPEGTDRRPARETARIVPLTPPRSRVLFVTSEMSDFVQAGGLGAVRLRCRARSNDSRRPGDAARLSTGARRARAMDIVAHLPGPRARVPLLDRPDEARRRPARSTSCCARSSSKGRLPYADAGGDFSDNDLRFARLSLAAAQVAARLRGWKPAGLHLNDWQTALAAGYLAWNGVDAPALLSVHNLAHQGLFEASRMRALGIPGRRSRCRASSSSAASPSSRRD